MKKINIVETSIIGFFVGVSISAYEVYTISNNGIIGEILNWVSLRPLLLKFQISDTHLLIYSFIFFVAVFTIYGLIFGLINKMIQKSFILLIPILLLISGMGLEQYQNLSYVPNIPEVNTYMTASVIKSIPKTPKQYFGNEAIGDLNNDNTDDVAFLIQRNDSDRGTLYYLAAALSTTTGKIGTNLIFLGDKIHPQNISIDNEIIKIDALLGSSTTTEELFAYVDNGTLIQGTSTQK